MQTSSLEGGFADPSRDAAYAFRAVMEAMARPGQIETLTGAAPPAPISPAAGTVLLTLCDHDTPLYLAGEADTEDMRNWVRFHLGAPLCEPDKAMFALGTWDALLPLDPYPLGTAEYPDRSTTLIVELPDLKPNGTILSGPGIQDISRLSLPESEAFRENSAHFPLGLDFIFTSDTRVAALPRTTKVA